MIGTQVPVLLIVEDAPEIASIMRIAFRKTELTMHYCSDGFRALEFVEEYIPDVIVLDLGMPGMNGWEFLDTLREKPQTKDIPVIILTAYANTENEQKAAEKGVIAFLTKPIDFNALRKAISKAI